MHKPLQNHCTWNFHDERDSYRDGLSFNALKFLVGWLTETFVGINANVDNYSDTILHTTSMKKNFFLKKMKNIPFNFRMSLMFKFGLSQMNLQFFVAALLTGYVQND